MRLRLRTTTWSRSAFTPALVLTDTPRPDCRHCHGEGAWTEYVQDGPDPEDGERVDVACDCWTSWHRTLLRVPRRLAALTTRGSHRTRAGYSDEPPF